MSKKKTHRSELVNDFLSEKPEENTRETGINIIGAVPWGTHLCQFYKTREDLIDILVPYFKTGLKNNEFCMWVTSEPLNVVEAKKALKKVLNNLDDYIKKGQIEILDSTDWYTKSGKFDADEVLAGWVQKEEWARKKGFDGLRLSGNTFWLEKQDWEDFKGYEGAVNNVIGKYHMIAICSYSLDKCNASEIIDVVSNHQFALIKREGKWLQIESPKMKENKEELMMQRQLLETVVKHIPIAVNLIRGRDLRLQLINPAYQTIAPGKNMVGKTLNELWPETGQNFSALCRKVLATGEPYHVQDELNMIRRQPNGPLEPAYFSWSLYRVRLPGDEGWGLLNTAMESTERKKSEDELIRRLQMINQVQDGIIACDADFRIIYWNKGAEKMYGYNQSEALGKTTQELLQPIYNIGEREKIINNLNRHGKSKNKIHIKHRNGSDIIVEAYTTRLTKKLGTDSGYIITHRDITEQERARIATKEAELKYRTVADNTYDFEFWIDQEGNYLYVSPSCKRITGYDAKNFLSNSSLRQEIVYPDDKMIFLDHLNREVSKKKPGELEFRILHKDGSIKWIHHVCQPINDENGKFLGTRGSNRDITERKKADEQLHETRDYLENLLNYANAPIIVWDSNFKITRFNHAFEHLTGYSSKEMIGKNLDILFPIENKEKTLQKIKRTLKGEFWESVEIPILHKNGQIRIALWNSANVYDISGKKLVATIAQGQDITERKQIEKKLQESEEKYRRIVENTTNVIMVTQPDGIISYLSPSCKEIIGYPPEELIGKNPIIFHPDDIEKVQQVLSKALKGEKGSLFEYRIITKQGIIKWISHSWAPIFYNKKIQSVVSVIEDISKRKETENNIKELNENLVHHARELSAANKELEAFSYSVSHDLRAPLRSINGFSQALIEDYTNLLDEQGKEYLQRVQKASQYMGQLIDDMLKLSRLTRAEMNINKVDLCQIATSIIERLEKEEPERKIDFIIQDKILAKGDPNLINILLENLLGNAWKFTKKCKRARIEFGKKQINKETVFFIQDNGVGFDMKYINKLFIPFQRLHNDNDYPGTGIGLGIVSRIINRHGGRIWAEGEENKGATFYFTLGGKINE